MRILVCIKQVPVLEEDLELDREKNWTSSEPEYRISRFDEYALEEALILKDRDKDILIDVISAGPERSESAIRRALGMGADGGVHIKLDKDGFVSSDLISSFISEYALKKKYDLIFTGIMSEDAMNCTTGPLIASKTGIISAVSAVELKLNDGAHSITVTSELEGGLHQEVELSFPCLVTFQSGKNTPRYPSLSNMLRANKEELTIIEKEVGDSRNISVFEPERSSDIVFIEGSDEKKAEELFNIFKKRSLLKTQD